MSTHSTEYILGLLRSIQTEKKTPNLEIRGNLPEAKPSHFNGYYIEL